METVYSYIPGTGTGSRGPFSRDYSVITVHAEFLLLALPVGTRKNWPVQGVHSIVACEQRTLTVRVRMFLW